MKMRFLVAALIAFAMPAHAELPIQEVKSPGGLTAWLVEDHGIPFTALEIRFQGGTSLDPVEQRGVVNLMTALLEEGAGEMDSQAFAEARDALAAQFGFGADRDSVSISAQFLSENRPEAIALLRQALVAPRFDAEAVERVRGQVLANIRSDAKDPDAISSQVFSRAAFGNHAYGEADDGTEASVAALSRADIEAARNATMARDRVFIAAAGDITAPELAKLLDELLGELPATGAALPKRAEWLLKGGVTVVDFPTPQSVIRFGHQGIKRDDPDFFAAYILNEILGGGRFTARLMTEIRDKRGLTYGIGSYLVPMDHAEIMLGQFSSANTTAGQAIDLVRAEWEKMRSAGVTPEELAKTKTYLTGSYPLRFDGNGPIAQILVGMQLERLPIDYAKTRNAKIEAVTEADVLRIAQRLLKPADLHFVVVGQPVGVVTTP